jgi:hypothetical protein
LTYESLRVWRAELADLEARAGIAKKVEDSKSGSLFMDFDAKPDVYFREKENSARRKVRDLYFEIEDPTVRTELIRKSRECYRARLAHHRQNTSAAQRELATAHQRAASQAPWIMAAVIAGACVAFGAHWFALYGAIGGALVGFFIGHGALTKERDLRAQAVRLAQSELEKALKHSRESARRPEWFNESEALTGARDAAFDLESVGETLMDE